MDEHAGWKCQRTLVVSELHSKTELTLPELRETVRLLLVQLDKVNVEHRPKEKHPNQRPM